MNSGKLHKSQKTTDFARPESALEEQAAIGDQTRSCVGGIWYRPHTERTSDAVEQMNH